MSGYFFKKRGAAIMRLALPKMGSVSIFQTSPDALVIKSQTSIWISSQRLVYFKDIVN